MILIKIVRGMLTAGLMCAQNFLRNPDSKKGIKNDQILKPSKTKIKSTCLHL